MPPFTIMVPKFSTMPKLIPIGALCAQVASILPPLIIMPSSFLYPPIQGPDILVMLFIFPSLFSFKVPPSIIIVPACPSLQPPITAFS